VQEAEYLWNLLVDSIVVDPDTDEVAFQYRLGSVAVCRATFYLALGFGRRNTRLQKFEAKIRQGARTFLPTIRKPRKCDQKERTATQWITARILIYSEKSPNKALLYVERQRMKEVHTAYETWYKKQGTCAASTFKKLWHKVMKQGVVCPATANHFKVKWRRRRAAGFKKCNKCAEHEFKVMMAKTKTERQEAITAYRKHHAKVRADRDTLDRVRLECAKHDDVVGVMIDAWDNNKGTMPTMKSTAKNLGGLKRIKNKLTGVEFINKDRELYLFRTLPCVSTGANLTLTILLRLFQLGVMDKARHAYINWDGASDNVNYTCIKTLIHLLISAEKKGWPLRKFTILRLQVLGLVFV
jgi:hypothetical protein